MLIDDREGPAARLGRCAGLIPWATAIGLAGWMSTVPVAGLAAQSPDTISPPHRRHHALAYDPAGQRVLLYGGQHLAGTSDAPALDDLWSWDGRRWSQLAPHTGIGMMAHKLYVDGAGAVFTTANALGRTTRWNGSEWITVLVDSTTRREMAGGAFDSDRKRFVLFGGHVGGRAFPGDTWEFDGRRWNRVATSGPPPMLGGAMAYDTRRRVVVLFGGLDSAGRKLGDTWEWDGARWTRVSNAGPSPRFGTGIAYDMRRGETVIFGGVGTDDQKLDDTWRWHEGAWQRAESATVPPARSEGYLAYDQRRQVIVMFGGESAQTVPTLGDTWEWNGTRWAKMR